MAWKLTTIKRIHEQWSVNNQRLGITNGRSLPLIKDDWLLWRTIHFMLWSAPGPLRTKTNIENQPQSLRLQPWKRDLHHLEHFFCRRVCLPEQNRVSTELKVIMVKIWRYKTYYEPWIWRYSNAQKPEFHTFQIYSNLTWETRLPIFGKKNLGLEPVEKMARITESSKYRGSNNPFIEDELS